MFDEEENSDEYEREPIERYNDPILEMTGVYAMGKLTDSEMATHTPEDFINSMQDAFDLSQMASDDAQRRGLEILSEMDISDEYKIAIHSFVQEMLTTVTRSGYLLATLESMQGVRKMMEAARAAEEA